MHRAFLSSRSVACVLLLAAPIASPASADWPTDPSSSAPIAIAPNDTVQPKIVEAPNGGSYVSWFDNRNGGYDVYLQRLDRDGNPMWTANGILIADLSNSSTQDYGLTVDGVGGCAIAFLDTRLGGVKVTVTRVDENGVQVWGDLGKQMPNAGASQNSPRVALSGDGAIVVGWSESASTGLHRFELDGTNTWPSPVYLTVSGANLTLADIRTGDGSSVIVSGVRATGFAGAKTLRAQKVDASGALLWGPSHATIFSTGSLQFGNFPTFVSDGAGGAVFAWYTTSPLQSFAQRVAADGTVLWGTNGIGVTTTTTRERTNPSVAFDPATQTTFVGWLERVPSTSNYGAYAQAFDATGARLWGSNGTTLLATQANFGTREMEAEVLNGKGTFFYVRDTAFANGTLFAAQVNADGSPAWRGTNKTVSAATVGYSRLETISYGDHVVGVWQDTRNGNDDLYGASILDDGSLGVPPVGITGDLDGDGSVGAADLAILLGAWGGSGGPADLNADGTVDALDIAILLGAWTS
jgi:hypothetical protein